MELGGCISCGVQAYRTVISFLAIRMRSGPPASWKQPRSALGVGAPVILPQRGYGRGDPQVGMLLPAMPADWLAGWLAGQRPCWLEDRLRLEGVRVISVFIPMVCLILMLLG